MKHEKVLDLGCGLRKTPGSVGCDMISLPSVDVVHDLNSFPYPFPDEELLGAEWLVNKFPRIYERFFVYMLPVSEVYYSLTKI